MQNNSENAISDLDCDCAPLYNEDEILGSMTIINFVDISYKKQKSKTDILSSIIELCAVKGKYKYCSLSGTTKAFWETIINIKLFKLIFNGYTSETLRKYWRAIRRCKNIVKFVEIIQANSSIINTSNINLSSIIEAISSFIISGGEMDFQDFFNKNIKGKRKILKRIRKGKKAGKISSKKK